mmetsp:Transcript_35140/g.76933  ORF Transcript_35140/g.76933 Transcript_35140/m.76933 type:complete len:271 (-) Transcript_35140:61-873(-)
MSSANDGTGTGTSRQQRRQKTQTVYIIRHGVALHNIPDARTKAYPDLFDPQYTDPPLVPWGTQQATEAAGKIQNDLSRNNKSCVDLVVSSPLRRCLQTSSIVFPPINSPKRVEPSDPSLRRPRILVNEMAREAYGVHYPDRRGKRSSIVAEFPWVELSPDFTEEDAQWRPDKRESLQDVKVRASSFLSWLASNCQEETIGIVSHGVWIEVLLLRYCPEVLDNGQRRVYNCDIFKARCISVWEEKVDTVGTQEWNLLSVRLEGCEILGTSS